MAVIEEESPDESDRKSPEAVKAGADYNSDGYETASDTELQEDVAETENCTRSNETDASWVSNGGHGEHSASGDVKAEESHEKTESIGAEAIERALNEANDAKAEGNALFKSGLYEEALSKYEFAIQIAPEGSSSSEVRSMCFANRAAWKYEETIKECTKALEVNPNYVKAILRRAEAHEKLEHYEESMADMNKILELDPSNDQARRTIIRLKPLADEKREKMKEEMIGKLKEMGNSILGRFGMSIDNFKAVKDPNTGSYSISYQS